MTHPSKQKGNRFEREIVKLAQEFGLKAVRCWGSDGRSMGLAEEVDVVIEDYTIQAKIRKAIAKWILPTAQVDAQVVRANNGKSFIIMRFEDWLCDMKDKKMYLELIGKDTKKYLNK